MTRQTCYVAIQLFFFLIHPFVYVRSLYTITAWYKFAKERKDLM